MKYAGIIHPALNAYDGVAIEIYPCGCYRDCKGCHSPDLQDFEYGEEMNIVDIINSLEEKRPWFDIISIIGGDLLCHDFEECMRFIIPIYGKFLEKKFWLFTGAELEDVPCWAKNLFDVIKTGVFIEELKQDGFPASSNQKVNYKGRDY